MTFHGSCIGRNRNPAAISGSAIWYVRWSKSILYTLIVTNTAKAPPAMAMMFSWSRTPIHSSPTGAISPFVTAERYAEEHGDHHHTGMGGTARSAHVLSWRAAAAARCAR